MKNSILKNSELFKEFCDELAKTKEVEKSMEVVRATSIRIKEENKKC